MALSDCPQTSNKFRPRWMFPSFMPESMSCGSQKRQQEIDPKLLYSPKNNKYLWIQETDAANFGSVNINVDPIPKVLSTKISPPFRCTKSLQSANPKPDPFSLLVPLELDTTLCPNSFSRISSDIPTPLSET